MLMHSLSALDTAAFHLIYTHIYNYSSEIGEDIDFLLEESGAKMHIFLLDVS